MYNSSPPPPLRPRMKRLMSGTIRTPVVPTAGTPLLSRFKRGLLWGRTMTPATSPPDARNASPLPSLSPGRTTPSHRPSTGSELANLRRPELLLQRTQRGQANVRVSSMLCCTLSCGCLNSAMQRCSLGPLGGWVVVVVPA